MRPNWTFRYTSEKGCDRRVQGSWEPAMGFGVPFAQTRLWVGEDRYTKVCRQFQAGACLKPGTGVGQVPPEVVSGYEPCPRGRTHAC